MSAASNLTKVYVGQTLRTISGAGHPYSLRKPSRISLILTSTLQYTTQGLEVGKCQPCSPLLFPSHFTSSNCSFSASSCHQTSSLLFVILPHSLRLCFLIQSRSPQVFLLFLVTFISTRTLNLLFSLPTIFFPKIPVWFIVFLPLGPCSNAT